MWEVAKQYNTPLALAVINLDNFKDVNDQHDNVFADNVLKRIAEILHKALFRFIVARSSGKEFYVLIPGLDNAKAVTLVDKVRSVIAREDFLSSKGNVFVTCSAGVANSLEERLQDQIAHAESIMRRAKEAGKNIVFGEDDEEDED